MNMEYLTVVLSTIIVLAVPQLVQTSCPFSTDEEALQQISACQFYFDQAFLSLYFFGTTTRLESYCIKNAAAETQCVSKVFNNCPDVGKLVNVTGYRTVIRFWCENTGAVSRQSTCIAGQQGDVNLCIANRRSLQRSWEAHLKFRASTEGKAWLEEQLRIKRCEYHRDVIKCQNSYGQNCGQKVQELFNAIQYAIVPSYCGGNSIKQNIHNILAGLILSIIFVFRT